MLRSLNIKFFPQSVHLVVADNPFTPDSLFDDELECCNSFSAKRKRDFVSGRVCAHRALESIGIRPSPVLIDRDRGPIWPKGVVGSITHCDYLYAAAVALKSNFIGLGIDIELNKEFPEEIESYVFTESENILIYDHPEIDSLKMLIFSYKESIYKCICPIVKRYIDFHEVEVTINTFSNTLFAKLNGNLSERLSLEYVQGVYSVNCDYIFTAAFLKSV